MYINLCLFRTDLFNACAKIISEEPRISYRVTEYSQTISFVPKPKPFLYQCTGLSIYDEFYRKRGLATGKKTIKVDYFSSPRTLSQQTGTPSLDRLNLCCRPLGPLEPSRQLTPIEILSRRRLHTPERLAGMATYGAII